MADLPISFSGPMVRMLIDDKKTQTRRLGAPRYKVGDRLYVREAWRVQQIFDGYAPVSSKKGRPILRPDLCALRYVADSREQEHWMGKYRQAMHMPRWASRMFLSVHEVRSQPLQEISPEDAIAEGIYAAAVYGGVVQSWLPFEELRTRFYEDPREAYFALLDHLHGPGFSAGNPVMAAYSFTRTMGNIDAEAA